MNITLQNKKNENKQNMHTQQNRHEKHIEPYRQHDTTKEPKNIT